MKLLGTLMTSFLSERALRRNLRALGKLMILLVVVVAIFTVLFHVIMLRVEGREHSWFTGVYWTLTVMSTLGFGDITFDTDLGKFFSMTVLFTGMILLLIVLPFAFIRFFYAPWLETQLRMRAPRSVEEDLRDHVIITNYDSIAVGLVERLKLQDFEYVVLEPDPTQAAHLHWDGIHVVTGALDDRQTYTRLRAGFARLVVANHDDITNTTITLTVREVAPKVPLAAVYENLDSQDILELAGASHTLPLKKRLGEQLANLASPGKSQAREVGRFQDLIIAEFAAHNTPLAGKTLAESGLREETGVSVVGIWQHGRMKPASANTLLGKRCLPVVVGRQPDIDRLNEHLGTYPGNTHPVLIIGGGKVGRAAARALKARGIRVHMLEKKPELAERIGDLPDRLIIGDAARRETMQEAGLMEAPSVLITASDDAVNIYLAVYCRRLRPDILIVSRLTHAKNSESIRSAGADLALTYASLGVETVLSLVQRRQSVILGEGVELLDVDVPRSLAGTTLGKSGLGEHLGVTVIGIRDGDRVLTDLNAETVLPRGAELAMIGTREALEAFMKTHGKGKT